jgi:ATP synthase protein I
VLTQALLTLGVALSFGVSHGLAAFEAALYGGAVTILVSAWQGWRMQRAAGLGAVYLSVIARYAMVVMLLALGLGVFRLTPIPLVVAFAVTQFGYLVYIRRAHGRA